MNLLIYGAQEIALGVYYAIKEINKDKNVLGFLVTSMEGNPSELGGLPVRELEEFVSDLNTEQKKEIEVWISTQEQVMDAIEYDLKKVGLYRCLRMDSLKRAELQKMAFNKYSRFVTLESCLVGNKKAELQVFKMVHHKDRALKTEFMDPEYVVPLQVGAYNSEERIAELTDDCGENISNKNGNFCEITGLYWIWKNCVQKKEMFDNEYIGLAHYRRFLDLSNEDIYRLVDNGIDVVLPYPLPQEPNIEKHHIRYLSDKEWNATLRALEELEPIYAEALNDILNQEYMYNYNVIIAKKNVINEYCNWLFPILFRIEEINNTDGEKTPNRYMGYIAETLETLYFMHNKDSLKIVHTGCRFLV